ncbi:MAG: tRNA (adenosine(37)-N6)-threonylcarbamoyltransferase complex ATPase subunit type 1 TsaE [Thermodesulfobacteriota bacterium]|nr:tRNA (adenosine(37)-N6)-threonylcarbamoyltransferase complex ATPase subunit type 1 TsaE [Thermodesulfobacteriota bacterium]
MICKQIQITTESLEETQLLGQKIGALISAGTVICLIGDLGSGKTSFVQGLAMGLGVSDDYYITSPTYVLINEYPGRYPLFHVDLYRMEDHVDFEDIGLYEILRGKGVVVVEWSDKLSKNFLAEYLTIHFEILNDESRKLTISANALEVSAFIERIAKAWA